MLDMTDRVLAKVLGRALTKTLSAVTPQDKTGRDAMANLMLVHLLDEVGGCPVKLMEVLTFLDEIKHEFAAEAAGTAVPTQGHGIGRQLKN